MSSNDKATADKLRSAATGQPLSKKEPTSFPQLLTAYKSQIAAALPKHISGDRMLRVALTAFRQNPKLAECEPRSVFAACVVGAQLGLEPGILGQAYLVPYNDRKNRIMICQFIPGWQGLVDLVNRSGRASVWTGAVYKGDEFEYEYGSNPHIHHKPNPDGGDDGDPANLLYVYSVGRVKGSEFPVIDVQSNLKVRRHRDRYNKVGDAHYSYENFEMYARKVPLMQVLKYMPKSIEMQNAVVVSYGADSGHVIDIKEAMDGTFLPPAGEIDTAKVIDEQTPADTVDTKTGEITQGQKKVDVPATMAERIAWVKGPTLEVTDRWQTLRTVYASAMEPVPIDIEAVVNDRREFIKARDERAKGN